jgi:hypothetical protein
MHISKLVLLISLAALGACVAGSQTAPPPPGPGAPPAPAEPAAAPAPDYPRSGGPSREEAESIEVGPVVEGVAPQGGELFYALTAEQGTNLEFTFYSEGIWDGRSGMIVRLNVIDQMGGKLFGRSEATYANTTTTDLDKEVFTFKPKDSGQVFFQIDCTQCKADVHYKFQIKAITEG